MADRSVGNIQVTVQANTNRLKAQLVKDGKVAGKAMAEEIQAELDALDVAIENTTEEGRLAGAVLRRQIEAHLQGIDVGLDLKKSTAELRKWREIEEAKSLQLALALDETDAAEVAARLQGMSAKQWTIFFDSDFDTTEVDAELERIHLQKHTAEILAELDEKFVLAEIARLEKERHFAHFIATLDVRQAELDIVAAKELAERQRINMVVEVDQSHFDRAVAEMRAKALGVESFKITFFADLHAAALEVLGFKEKTEADVIQQKVETDLLTARIRADRELLEAMMGELGIPTHLTFTEARLERLAFEREMKANAIQIPVETDERKWFEMGENAGSEAGRGLSTRWKAIIAGIVALAEPAAVALEGLLAASVSVLSSAFSALAGSAGALVPIFVGMGTSVATLIVGFQGMGDALGGVTKEFAAAVAEGRQFNPLASDITDAMAGLAPAAQDTVRAFSDLMPVFADIRSAVQQRLFIGIGDELRELSSSTLPNVGKALGLAADSLNRFFRGLGDVVADTNFKGMFRGLQPAIDLILDGFLHLTRAIEPFVKAATPAARELAESFRRAAERLGDLISAGAKTGHLESFLLDGIDSLREWWDLIRNVGDALFTLFEAGKDSGDSFVGSLADVIARFDDWMESVEGQDALQEFFATGQSVMEAMVPILEGLQGMFANLVTDEAVDRFTELAIALGDVLPFLGQLFEIVGETGLLITFVELLGAIADAVQPIIPALDDLATMIGQALGSAVDQIGDSLPGLAESFERLAIALGPNIADVIELIADAMSVAVPLFATALDVFSALPEPLQTTLLALLAFRPLIGTLSSVGNAFTILAKKFLDPTQAIISSATLWQAGITVAVTGVIAIWSKLTEKSREVERRSRELGAALSDEVTNMIESGEAAENAALGYDALNSVLTNSDEESKKVNTALGALGQTTDDAWDRLSQFSTDQGVRRGIHEIGESLGLTGYQAEQMALTVNKSGRAFTGAGGFVDSITRAGTISREEIVAMVNNFEDLKEGAAAIDFDAQIRQALNLEAAHSSLNQALLAQAERQTGIKRTGTGLITLWKAYTDAQHDVADATDDAITEAIPYNDELGEIGSLMPGLIQDTGDLAEETQVMSDKLATAADEADRAAEKADALKTAWDKLFGVEMNLAEAHDQAIAGLQEFSERADEHREAIKKLSDAQADRTESIAEAEAKLAEVRADGEATAADREKAENDLAQAIRDGDQAVWDAQIAVNESTLALKGNSKAAIENRDKVRSRVEETLAEADAMIRQGKSYKDVQKFIKDRIDLMGDEAEAAGFNRDVFDSLLKKYKLTPTAVTTSIKLANREQIQEDLDTIREKMTNLQEGEVVVTTRAEGIELVKAGLDGVIGTRDDITERAATLAVGINGKPETMADLEDLVLAAEEVDGKQITLGTRLQGIEAVTAGLDGIVGTTDDINAMTATAAVATDGVPKTQEDLDKILNKIIVIDGEVATVKTESDGVKAVMAGLDGISNTTDDINKKPARQAVEALGVPKTNDELGKVITKAEQLSLTPAKVKVEFEMQEWQTQRAGMPLPTPDGTNRLSLPPVTLPIETSGFETASKHIADLQEAAAKKMAPVNVSFGDVDYKLTTDHMNTLATKAEEMPAATVEVGTDGLDSTNSGLDTLANKISTLNRSSVDIPVTYHVTTTGGPGPGPGIGVPFQHGGQARYGRMNIAGEIGPELTRFGSRHGLVDGPTIVAPGTMVTSAAGTHSLLNRLIAAIESGRPSGKQVNNYMTVTPIAADPAAVATQVLNRAAVLAR